MIEHHDRGATSLSHGCRIIVWAHEYRGRERTKLISAGEPLEDKQMATKELGHFLDKVPIHRLKVSSERLDILDLLLQVLDKRGLASDEGLSHSDRGRTRARQVNDGVFPAAKMCNFGLSELHDRLKQKVGRIVADKVSELERSRALRDAGRPSQTSVGKKSLGPADAK